MPFALSVLILGFCKVLRDGELASSPGTRQMGLPHRTDPGQHHWCSGGVHLACLQHPHRGSSAPVLSAQGVLSLVASEPVFAPKHSLTPSPSARSASWAPMDSQSPIVAAPALLLSFCRCFTHPWCLAFVSRIVAKPSEPSQPRLGIGGVWGLRPAVPCTQPGSGQGQVPSQES